MNWSSASPGEFLFFEDIQDSCKTDLSVYSFGIGDEPYKRSWCDIEIPTYDTNVSFDGQGQDVCRLSGWRAKAWCGQSSRTM